MRLTIRSSGPRRRATLSSYASWPRPLTSSVRRHRGVMDISRGFQIEQPAVFVPWGISEAALKKLFEPGALRHVTSGYFTVSCNSLGGLAHNLGFHFQPREAGALSELEFFRASYPDQAASFTEFQRHLEASFGPPTATKPGTEGFSSYLWQLQGADVVHYLFDRFGPEEHVRIRRQ